TDCFLRTSCLTADDAPRRFLKRPVRQVVCATLAFGSRHATLQRKEPMMFKRIVLCAAAVMLMTAAPALAQVEVGVFAGYSFAEGFSGNNCVFPGEGTFNRVDPKDSFPWGFDVGVLIGQGGEVGFLYGNYPTTLEISGTATKDVGDLKVNTYHGYFAY